MFGLGMGAKVPWSEKSIMEQRREFVMLFEQAGTNRSALCARFGISRELGYRLARSYRSEGEAGLFDRSRRPRRSPDRTPDRMEALVLSIRERHPSWGGRKIRRRLLDLAHEDVPSASTITEVLRRHGCIDPAASAARATATVRACGSQRSVADGLQGPFPDRQRAMPSADGH